MTSYQHIKVPAEGQKITVNADMSLNVPDEPIIPFIEGDGTGLDITPVMIKVVDAAVAKAYGGKKKINGSKYWAIGVGLYVKANNVETPKGEVTSDPNTQNQTTEPQTS